MSSIAKLWRKLRNKAYRDGYTEAQLSIEVPFQIRALRKARGWTQTQLAKLCGIPQARISHIEQPGRDPLSLRTLYRLSAAFDVGLLVQFVPFSELVRREAAFDPETFRVSSFEDDRLEMDIHSTDTLITSPLLRIESTRGTWRPHPTQTRPEGKVQTRTFSLLVKKDTELSPPFFPLDYNSLATERTHHGYETHRTG